MHQNINQYTRWVDIIGKENSPEELQKVIEKSNHFEDLDKNDNLFKIYNNEQAFKRQVVEEKHKYDEISNYYLTKGRENPYSTIGAFRRSYRSEKGSEAYKKSHYWKLSENEIINAPPKAYAIEIIKAKDYVDKFKGVGGKNLIKAIVAESRTAIRRCDQTNNEHGAIIDVDGNILFSFSGKNSSADYTGFNFDKYKTNSLVMTHNHPNSRSFSVDDILTASQYPQIKTIVATGHDGTVYSLSIEKGKRVDRSIEREYNTIYVGI